ncbi:MAG: 2-C-methyl-D-erythritol 4-phosphate cytidylyltransferase [Clostridia bacterium]|nr:2-C-methyl-D-erythritol 4-phosphate cytidylyltransferase [Clostridia bacterium]
MAKTAAVLVCAGSGSRMKGSCDNKLLFDRLGIPVAVHALRAYDETEGIDLLVIVTQKDLVPVYQRFKKRFGIKKEMIVTVGGDTRMESVLNGVRVVPNDYDFIAIGDGARPLIRSQEIRATLEAGWTSGAAALGMYLTDTIKEVADGKIQRTIPRDVLVGIQTPQVFRREEYLELAERAVQSGESFTDDASIYEHYGKTVVLVEGRRDNIKITVPEDIAIFLALMEEQE